MPEPEQRIWGSFEVLQELTDGEVKIKELRVKPGRALSLQKHAQRSEIWIVQSGCGSAIIGGTSEELTPGRRVEICQSEWHQLINGGSEDLVIFEVQFGERCAEEDIRRAHER
jgi:mannose-6-phosphate isomerase-like protein (cupin superfamily)